MYRIDQLLKANRKLFHTKDLALLWGITNSNSLYTLIKRYVERGILIPIHKGFYSTVSLDQIDTLRLGLGYLHRYAYLSCESILLQEGIISQYSGTITLVSDVSKRFILEGNEYLVRKLNIQYLYNDNGLIRNNGVLEASPDRAVADMLYFNPKYHFDIKTVIGRM